MKKSRLQDYRHYVGPLEEYDMMGATQFRLLCTLGLRAHHQVLDFGCGSLRAGRLLIQYLDADGYCGIEPNRWLIDAAINEQIGQDLIRIKKPQFDHNEQFAVDAFGKQFDFIVAQSIFSHTDKALTATALRNFYVVLKPNGMILATFKEGETDFDGSGWIYPTVVTYRPVTIEQFAADAGLAVVRLPWYHPRQRWYAFTKDAVRLPSNVMMRYLDGAVLFDPEFAESWQAHAPDTQDDSNVGK